jgi:DNA-binding transcriptional regulator YdaS (Cro superfamily)
MTIAETAWATERKALYLIDIAKGLGISLNAVSRWTRVPAERVADVSRLTGVPRERLRPDLYPPEPWSAL